MEMKTWCKNKFLFFGFIKFSLNADIGCTILWYTFKNRVVK